MELTIFNFIMHGGVPALSLVLLYLLAKHHIKTLAQYRLDEHEWFTRTTKLEEAYRLKVEELLKEQIKWVERISETLAESAHAIESIHETLNKKS